MELLEGEGKADQWACGGWGDPRAGERAGGADLSWSSGAARRKEGRKKEAPIAGPRVVVAEGARAGALAKAGASGRTGWLPGPAGKEAGRGWKGRLGSCRAGAGRGKRAAGKERVGLVSGGWV